MFKDFTVSNKNPVEAREAVLSIKAKPFLLRLVCKHHLLCCGLSHGGFRKIYVCEKCGHIEFW